MKREILRMERLRISNNEVQLHNININLFYGEVLGLIGLNDSGKTTITKILNGTQSIDEGNIYLYDKKIMSNRIKKPSKMGIFCIYNNLQLIPNLMISDNIFVIRENSFKKITLNENAINNETNKLLKSINMNVNPKMLVEDLSIPDQYLILLIKAVSLNSKIIVIDDIFGGYSKKDIENLKQVICDLKNTGISFIITNNQFEDIMSICDRMTILREGTTIKNLYKDEFSEEKISILLKGIHFNKKIIKPKKNLEEEILRIKDLHIKGSVDYISLSLHKREILGIMDMDRTYGELLKEVFFSPGEKGNSCIILKGKEVKFRNYREALKYKIGIIPEDGLQRSIFNNMSLAENIIFMKLKNISNFLFIKNKILDFVLKEYSKTLNIKYYDKDIEIKELNKLNKQKVLLYRWLLYKPDIIIMFNPFRGMDAVSREEIHQLIEFMRTEGISFIIISSDQSELLNVCDRIAIINKNMIQYILNDEEKDINKAYQI